jgi:hypothetical protein
MHGFGTPGPSTPAAIWLVIKRIALLASFCEAICAGLCVDLLAIAALVLDDGPVPACGRVGYGNPAKMPKLSDWSASGFGKR